MPRWNPCSAEVISENARGSARCFPVRASVYQHLPPPPHPARDHSDEGPGKSAETCFTRSHSADLSAHAANAKQPKVNTMEEANKEECGPVVHVGGIPFQVSSLESATQTVLRLSSQKRAVSIRLANAYCVAVAEKDTDYRRLLVSDGINFPDGTPIVWFMRRTSLGRRVAGRVRGPSLFSSVLDSGREQGTRHFFLGATAETLTTMIERVAERYPGIEIAGSYAPRFGPVDSEFVSHATRKILDARPQIVWVALGTPKQDFATVKLAASTQLPCIGVGAAFDFMAGSVPEAPSWMQNSGTEWMFRLLSEPRRLWRRYVFGNVTFLYAVYRASGLSRSGPRVFVERESTKSDVGNLPVSGRARSSQKRVSHSKSETTESEGRN